MLEVSNPDFYYEPVRVDINSKGKVRARMVNNVQPTQVNQLPYPLRLKTPGRFKYFEKREEWKVTDMLMNPMVIMMVLPLLLITVLPKMMNDPETKREMEQMQQQMNVNNQVRNHEFKSLVAAFLDECPLSSCLTPASGWPAILEDQELINQREEPTNPSGGDNFASSCASFVTDLRAFVFN